MITFIKNINPFVVMPWLIMWVFAPAPLYIWFILEHTL